MKPAGGGVSELRIDYGPGYRVFRRTAQRRDYPSVRRNEENAARGHQGSQAVTGELEGKGITKTLPYDSAEFLTSPDRIRDYVDEALATGDASLIVHALGTAARAQSMTDIARKTGLSRENLYRTLSAHGHPEFDTVMRVLNALDLELSARHKPAKPRRKPQAAKSAKRRAPAHA